MTKTDDRWATRKEDQPIPVVVARNSKEKKQPVVSSPSGNMGNNNVNISPI